MTIESLVIIGIVAAVIYGVIRWVREAKDLSPDPWGAEVEKVIQDPQTRPLCHHCLLPQEKEGWFCPECGAATGQYNNYMPWVMVFSQGEVFRAGVNEKFRRSPLIACGYVLCSLACYAVFAPVYWYFLFKNLRRAPIPNGEDRGSAAKAGA